MVVDQAPSGEWRMIVGGYVHTAPIQNQFQIVEWRSSDQVNWRYIGPVLTTSQMPAQASSDIFSPVIQQFAPGLWRMLFSGDDRSAGGRIRIWSAVSTDREHWQPEGLLMANDPGNLYYVAVVDHTLITVRDDADTPPFGDQMGRRIVASTITMP